MLEVIAWIIVSVLTQLANKCWISSKRMVLIISLLAWACYYVANYFYPELTENIWKSMLEIYWFSQIVYNYVIKRFETKE